MVDTPFNRAIADIITNEGLEEIVGSDANDWVLGLQEEDELEDAIDRTGLLLGGNEQTRVGTMVAWHAGHHDLLGSRAAAVQAPTLHPSSRHKLQQAIDRDNETGRMARGILWLDVLSRAHNEMAG